MGKLTALQVKSAKPKDKQGKLTDGGGLYLLVMPNGSKYWRYDYRYSEKRKTLSLGVYPDVSLSDARGLHTEAKQKVKSGIDPTHERKVAKLTKSMAAENSFEAIAEEWFLRQMENKSEGHKARTRRLLEKDLYPSLGHFAIDAITPYSHHDSPVILGRLSQLFETAVYSESEPQYWGFDSQQEWDEFEREMADQKYHDTYRKLINFLTLRDHPFKEGTAGMG